MIIKEFESYSHAEQAGYTGIICIKRGYVTKFRIVYMVGGGWHRLDGPALYFGDDKQFYINGRMIKNEREFWAHPDVIKHAIQTKMELIINA